MTATYRVAVVGGGVLGTSAAARIAETGLSVALVADAPTTTRVSASFAWVNANANGDPAYEAFKTAARSEHRRRGRRAGGVYALLSHSGITLAPLLAELVARDLTGADDGRLTPYRPDSLIG